jgi:hypothetical protein
MGNTISSSIKKPQADGLSEYIDKQVSEYILNMDILNLSKMSDKAYCDKMVVLTTDIISKKFTHAEILVLKKRVEGNEVNKESLSFVDSDKLNDEDKRDMCKGIAKFYIKIAHLYAAIISTVNPVYEYEENGEKKTATLMNKHKIPKDVKVTRYELNICNKRIKSLQNYKIDENKNVSIQPTTCDMRSLNDEPGIPELKMLYYDDDFNYETGDFDGMSEVNKQKFSDDLKRFYTTFTGETDVPTGIQDFSGIKLRYYKDCSSNEIHINEEDDLFVLYAKHLNLMINNSKMNQNKLIQIIEQLMVSDNEQMRINPRLTEGELQALIDNARALIIDLYINCEEDYVKGIKIYESIVEHNILHTIQSQIDLLETKKQGIISQPSNIVLDNK